MDILTTLLQFSNRKAVPHLNGILQTVCLECSKSSQVLNIASYLRVFNAFLRHIGKWHNSISNDLHSVVVAMQIDDNEVPECKSKDLLQNWLDILEQPKFTEYKTQSFEPTVEDSSDAKNGQTETMPTAEGDDAVPAAVPQHVEIVKTVLNQVIKYIMFDNKVEQILALECIVSGIPLLKDYETELLVLVHSMWQPLVEKFRQQDAIVLHRCFDVLAILALHAKDFILQRSLK